ncbi:SRPBCC family protein [Spirochaeta isovalerica]|uniref:Ligand-binding SRPBCC domain-containing protein n=1 Tax=Spirochaeta isovalerica TaxID=150 RepID=A0A841R853_9SPIO|nr:SRPBCC family protein [Spirochaeta isovalerica]MBB6480055.1 ligand-binding SRPBCC domain-containing protein [Spirochaeta isovalerica]
MQGIELSINISAPREKVWSVITDIENSVNTISGIRKIEILEKGNPFIGLKWRETREMFGKEATEVMWIHNAEENNFYNVRAESHGSRYYTDFYLKDSSEGCALTMKFTAEIESFGARLVNFLLGWMFKNATIKALEKDLEDIKEAVEK